MSENQWFPAIDDKEVWEGYEYCDNCGDFLPREDLITCDTTMKDNQLICTWCLQYENL